MTSALSAKVEHVESRVKNLDARLTKQGERLQSALDKISGQFLSGSPRQVHESSKHPGPETFGDESFFPLSSPISFLDLATEVMGSRRTLLGLARLFTLWQAIQNVRGVALPAAEIGVYRGGSTYFLAAALRACTGKEPQLVAIDTFEGHPARSVSDSEPSHKAGHFGDTSVEDVSRYLSSFPGVKLVRGDVMEVAPGLEETSYALVHIDVDLHAPTRFCLDYFGSRLAVGGIIVVDDFRARKCPGVVRAVREFLTDAQGFTAFDLRSEQLLLVKSR